MSHSADRNLLFGILALQMDFIRRDQLVAGMNAWVLEKHKPLGQVLVEQQALRDDLRAALDAMVDKHIEVHQHDAQASLAVLSSVAGVSQSLGGIGDDDLQASLRRLTRPTNEPSTVFYTRPTPAAGGPRFRLIRMHARGGLGEVFVAEDAELHRQVALKQIQERHAGDPDCRDRFVMEAEITGRLEHPGIVPVYSLGAHGDGRPFYAMRFIKGDSLGEAIERFHQRPPAGQADAAAGPERDPAPAVIAADQFYSSEFRQLLRRYLDVCNAIAYAHSRGVLHRDLKPGNIMLGEFGETLVVDWGMAKVVGRTESAPAIAGDGTLRPLSDSSVAETQAGAALGTPRYMSPEQAAGRIAELGPASDVYSLGATLYALLTGVPPIDGGDVDSVLARVQQGDFPRPRARQPAAPPALEAVCLKAMALAPQDRYATAGTLAADVERWLADESVSAWPDPWAVRARRLVSRHRVVVTGAAAALLVAVIGSITANMLLSEANETIRKREQETGQANEKLIGAYEEIKTTNANLVKANEATKLAYGKLEKEKDAAEKARDETEDTLAQSRIQLARARFEEGSVALADEIVAAVPLKNRSSAWGLVKNGLAGSPVTLRGHQWFVMSVTYSPDGQTLASGSTDSTVKLWDARTGQELRTLRGHQLQVASVAYSPDGRTLASGSHDNTVKLWDVRTGQELHTLREHQNSVTSVAYSPDGLTLASGSGDNTVKLWDARTGKKLRALRGHENIVTSVAYSPDGRTLASGSDDSTVRLWDVRTGQAVRALRGHQSGVESVTYSPDGRTLASGSKDKTVKLWDARTGQELRTLRGHQDQVTSVTYSPDGLTLASGGEDKAVKLWDTRTDQALRSLRGHQDQVTSVVYSPDGLMLASGSYDNTVRLWDARTGQELRTLRGHQGGVLSVTYSPDGLTLASASADKTVKLWDARTAEELRTLRGFADSVPSVRFNSDGREIYATDVLGRTLGWKVADGQPCPATEPVHPGATQRTVSPDGHWQLVPTQEIIFRRRWDPLESTCRHASLSIL